MGFEASLAGLWRLAAQVSGLVLLGLFFSISRSLSLGFFAEGGRNEADSTPSLRTHALRMKSVRVFDLSALLMVSASGPSWVTLRLRRVLPGRGGCGLLGRQGRAAPCCAEV